MAAIEVRIWGARVGVIAEVPDSRAYAFEYYPAWARKGIELAPLTMPVRARGQLAPQSTWTFPGIGEGFRHLPGLIADALPDAFGNKLIDAWLLARGMRAERITVLDRLAYMSKRGIGALEFHPAKGSARESAHPLQLSELVEEARRAIQGDLGSPSAAAESLRSIIRVGTSAGGARPKAVIAWNPATNQIRSGQFDVPEAFEHWLLKFDGIEKAGADLGTPRGYGRIEYAYSQMAAAAGIAMSECRLLEEGGRAHFMTRRFDRTGNRKHHVQSLCALCHLDYQMPRVHAYEAFFRAAQDLGLGDAAYAQIFRRMVFNYVARNCDDHTKNFAFLLPEGGAWSLAPAFDVSYAYRPDSPWVAQHQMSVNGKFADATRADFFTISDRYAIPRARDLIDQVVAAVRSWETCARAAGVPAAELTRIAETFQWV